MVMGLSVMDVSEEFNFLFITAPIKALPLLQGSDGKLDYKLSSANS